MSEYLWWGSCPCEDSQTAVCDQCKQNWINLPGTFRDRLDYGREPARNPENTSVLPCDHPGVRNIQDTVNEYDYECPTCGEQYTREEIDR